MLDLPFSMPCGTSRYNLMVIPFNLHFYQMLSFIVVCFAYCCISTHSDTITASSLQNQQRLLHRQPSSTSPGEASGATPGDFGQPKIASSTDGELQDGNRGVKLRQPCFTPSAGTSGSQEGSDGGARTAKEPEAR